MRPTRSDHFTDEAMAKRGLSRETDIRLDAVGRWFSGGDRVEHPGIAAAFARWIERVDAGPGTGRYALRNDLHYVYVTVEGAPLHARGAAIRGAEVWLELYGDVEQRLRPETLRQGPDGVLYASGRDGTWPIRLAPEATLALAPLLEERGGEAVLVLDGVATPIPSRDDPLQH